jgi:hypothetical protein
MLQAAYDSIMKQFHLNRKSEFRAKMGATEDPIWICYPNVSLQLINIANVKANILSSMVLDLVVSELSWTSSRMNEIIVMLDMQVHRMVRDCDALVSQDSPNVQYL